MKRKPRRPRPVKYAWRVWTHKNPATFVMMFVVPAAAYAVMMALAFEVGALSAYPWLALPIVVTVLGGAVAIMLHRSKSRGSA
jgi:hypothetical protein